MYRVLLFFLTLVLITSCSKDAIDEIIPEPPVVIKPSFSYRSFEGINRTTSYSNSDFNPFKDYLLFNSTPDNWFSAFTAKVDFDGDENEDYVIIQSYHLDNEYGTIILMQNDQIIHRGTIPQTFTRKITSSDLDNDGDLDLVLFGTGLDANPWPGDFLLALYFTGTSYEIKQISDSKGYFHGGALGDINNDGLIDIVAIDFIRGNNFIYYNTGNKSFLAEPLLSSEDLFKVHTCELYDYDNDGYLDLFLGGHEWEQRTRIVPGSSTGFNIDKKIILPEVIGMGTITDFDFMDVNNDNRPEIIISRTGGSEENNNFYVGLNIQIVDGKSHSTVDLITLNGFDAWAWNTVLLDVNSDGRIDIAPFYPYLNNNKWLDGTDPILGYYGLYFENNNNLFTENYYRN